MGISISSGAWTTTPALILSISTGAPTGTQLHQLIGGGVAVSLAPVGLRTGTLELFYLTEAAARDAEKAHYVPGVFRVSYPERATLDGLNYVIAPGSLGLQLDASTRDRWTLTVPFQEVTP